VKTVSPLGFAHLLEDDLFGQLSGNAASPSMDLFLEQFPPTTASSLILSASSSDI